MKIIDILEEEERNKGMESLFTQIVDENFPNPWKETALESKKQMEHLVTSTQRGLLQGILY